MMYCRICGSPIDDDATVCPFCGAPTSIQSDPSKPLQPQPQSIQNRYNFLSVLGFVLSFFISIAGLVCCIIAKRQCRDTGEKGAALTTAGIIISIVRLALSIFWIVLSVMYFLR